MAVATPTILPVPTRPDSAIQNASNDEIPCAPSFLENNDLSISLNRRTCTNRVRKEKYKPAAISNTTRAGFQTIPLTWETIFSSMDPKVRKIFRFDGFFCTGAWAFLLHASFSGYAWSGRPNFARMASICFFSWGTSSKAVWHNMIGRLDNVLEPAEVSFRLSHRSGLCHG